MHDASQLRAMAAGLLQQAGRVGAFAIQALPGGGNNRVYRIESGSDALLLKVYFRHPHDPRDRLNAEFAFCRFAWDQGLRCIPRPLAADHQAGAGLYEFIEGRKLAGNEIGPDAVWAAADFYAALNRRRVAPAAARLPTASEACFSIAEHLECVGRRVQRLNTITPESPVDAAAAQLVERVVMPAWARSIHDIHAAIADWPETGQVALDPDERRISPSDFGFHNALRRPDGSLCFIDFEYAGWDDPAKMVCDFFCQVEAPAPMKYLADFIRRAEGASVPLRERVRLLLPVYKLKWCCIILNDFIPAAAARRRFARAATDEAERKREQLEKARRQMADWAELRIEI